MLRALEGFRNDTGMKMTKKMTRESLRKVQPASSKLWRGPDGVGYASSIGIGPLQ
jgi:hypothetical protein